MLIAMGFWEWIFGRFERTERASLSSVAPPPFALPPAPPPPSLEPAALPQAAPEPPPKPAPPRYGIDAAIALMRALPMDEDPDLVLRVVRKTLRSTGVSVEELIENARKRESSLSQNIAEDRQAIEELERDIDARRAHIKEIAAQLTETTSVRERLQEAVQSESKVGTLMPPEEMARLQAEAAAARASQAPASPPRPRRSSLPPAPKVSAAPPLAKSLAPKPPPVPSIPVTVKAPGPVRAPEPMKALEPVKVPEPPRDVTSNGDALSAAPPTSIAMPVATPVAPDVDSVSATDSTPPSEPTLKKAIDVTAAEESP